MFFTVKLNWKKQVLPYIVVLKGYFVFTLYHNDIVHFEPYILFPFHLNTPPDTENTRNLLFTSTQ